MPKLKQPLSLEKMALDALIECCVRYCDQRIRRFTELFYRRERYYRFDGLTQSEESDLFDQFERIDRFNRSPDFDECDEFDLDKQWDRFMEFELSRRYDYRRLDELRQGFSVIKENVCIRLPWKLLADFCRRFMIKIDRNTSLSGRRGAELEIMMDMEIVGLQLKGPIVEHLDLEDACRFRRLQELDLAHFPFFKVISLDNFHLDDLTTFISPTNCTDLDLTVIGRNCSKLQVLKIRKSEVTDEGLRALSPCSELRVVDTFGCPVSYRGLTGLLSVHKKLEKFTYWDHIDRLNGCDVSSYLGSSMCPSIKCFVLEIDQYFRPVDLQAIVAKFPNLTCLKIVGTITIDFSVLKSLNKLSCLEIELKNNTFDDEIEPMWDSLLEFLTFIGPNITTLTWSHYYEGSSEDEDFLNFIFESCPNIEYFAFHHRRGLAVIPPFRKLKELFPRVDAEQFHGNFRSRDSPTLEFSRLVNLETLSIHNYKMDLQTIESIMLDDVKFPNLSVIETDWLPSKDLLQIKLTAKNKNLDFKIKFTPDYHTCIKRWFGERS